MCSTPPSSRRRSAKLRSAAVTTITGVAADFWSDLNLTQKIFLARGSLLKNVFDAAVKSTTVSQAEIRRGYDNNRRRCRLLVLTELREEFKPVHFGHHEIKENEIGLLRGQSFERFAPSVRNAYRPTLADEQPPHHFAGAQVVLHDEYTGYASR